MILGRVRRNGRVLAATVHLLYRLDCFAFARYDGVSEGDGIAVGI